MHFRALIVRTLVLLLACNINLCRAGDATGHFASELSGFRHALFGMNEADVREAAKSDFPGRNSSLIRSTNPLEKTMVLQLQTDDLIAGSGPARISYILGYKTHRLIQVNIVFNNQPRSSARDAQLVKTANGLRDHLRLEYPALRDPALNAKVGEAMILVFRGSDERGRMVALTLAGSPISAGQRSPPLTLTLSYIADLAHPDIYRVDR